MRLHRRAALSLGAFFGLSSCTTALISTETRRSGTRLSEHIRTALAASSAPALGAVVVSCSQIEAEHAGAARSDTAERLAEGARFNIGSNAKSMLASLAATFVQDGVLHWESRAADIFAAEADTFDPVLRNATVAQFLSHRSGVPAFATGEELGTVHPAGATPPAQRRSFANDVLRAAPAYQPGAEFRYSNAGYIIVGAMLEHAGGEPFEALMQRRLFSPLGVTQAAFGADVGEPGQPLGHYLRDGVQAPYLDGDPIIPAFLQPAGDVSLPLADYGRYLQEHLCGLQGRQTRLLRPELIRVLHQPQGEDGASMGWGRYSFDGVDASIHVGGTGTFSAFVAVLPAYDLAVATVVNSGAPDARNAALTLMQTLIGERLSP